MKVKNWQSLLADHLFAQMAKPFEWGINDCCLFACDCVHVMTGQDPGTAYRNKYTTELGARRTLKRVGGGSIETAFNQVFGPLKPRLNAGRGDLALINTDLGPAVGIVCGGSVWAVGLDGLVPLPLKDIIGCWHVDNMQGSNKCPQL
jgi:hypothetical protein